MGIFKNIAPNNNKFEKTIVDIGSNTVSLTWTELDRTDTSSANTNLFASFNLPITTAQKNKYSTSYTNSGFLDTAFSGFNQNIVYIAEIPANQYGELIDGKKILISITTLSGTTYTAYSTFIYQTNYTKTFDSLYSDSLAISSLYGQPYQRSTKSSYSSNISYLVSDSIKEPQGDSGKTWSTGYSSNRPFANNKEPLRFYYPNDPSTVDEPIGIMYLDKGFIVITHPTIIANVPTGGTITFNSINTEYIQHIICYAAPGEFYKTNNPTYLENFGTAGYGIEPVYITELGLYNDNDELIAIAKADRPIPKNSVDLLSFNVQIKL